MSRAEFKPVWVLQLDPADARLILRALGGRLKGPEIEEAKRLGDDLTRQRAAQSASYAEEMKRHADNIDS